MLHDVVVQRSKKAAQARIMPVPPEEFGVSRFTRSLSDCNYCYHQPYSTEGGMIAQGYDPEQVKALPDFFPVTNVEEIDRDTVNENQYSSTSSSNKPARQVEVTEHYIRMDYEGSGELKLYKVTTGGSIDAGQILRKKFDGEKGYREDIEEMDMAPFAAMTPVIITHRFFGRSIADLVMDIQRVKTAVLRGILDNTYLANNPRVEVAEAMAGPDTLDDLLVARPGGIIRVRQPGGIQWQEVPNVAAGAFPVMEYMDSTREWRTGVTRQGQGIDANALQNQSATAVAQVYSAAQARIKLIARIFAETGMKDLFILLHGLIRKHGQETQTVRLRKKWVQIDPRDWKARNDLTVHVGLGTGSKTEQLAHMTTIAGLQKEALLGGPASSMLVNPGTLYETAKEITKLVGMKDVDRFWVDPATVPPQAMQPPPDPKVQQIQMQMQLEKEKAQRDTQLEAAKAQSQLTVMAQKHQADMELAAFNARIKGEEHAMQMQAEQQKQAHAEAAEARKGIEIQNAADVTKHVEAAGTALAGHFTALLDKHSKAHADSITKLHDAHMDALKKATAPRKRTVVRDKDGKATHSIEEPMK